MIKSVHVVILLLIVICFVLQANANEDPIMVELSYAANGDVCSLMSRPSYKEEDKVEICAQEVHSLLAWTVGLEYFILLVEEFRRQENGN